nr:MAG TPA: hypothetical protein [Siphoviridae sp. ct7ub6]DAP10133.1 MAG TPA: hypothetical protein [Caudoviricetes sp.]DAU89736.1 MAG TPA: hypothetical protein [Caudoviricetes sp.]
MLLNVTVLKSVETDINRSLSWNEWKKLVS